MTRLKKYEIDAVTDELMRQTKKKVEEHLGDGIDVKKPPYDACMKLFYDLAVTESRIDDLTNKKYGILTSLLDMEKAAFGKAGTHYIKNKDLDVERYKERLNDLYSDSIFEKLGVTRKKLMDRVILNGNKDLQTLVEEFTNELDENLARLKKDQHD